MLKTLKTNFQFHNFIFDVLNTKFGTKNTNLSSFTTKMKSSKKFGVSSTILELFKKLFPGGPFHKNCLNSFWNINKFRSLLHILVFKTPKFVYEIEIWILVFGVWSTKIGA